MVVSYLLLTTTSDTIPVGSLSPLRSITCDAGKWAARNPDGPSRAGPPGPTSATSTPTLCAEVFASDACPASIPGKHGRWCLHSGASPSIRPSPTRAPSLSSFPVTNALGAAWTKLATGPHAFTTNRRSIVTTALSLSPSLTSTYRTTDHSGSGSSNSS